MRDERHDHRNKLQEGAAEKLESDRELGHHDAKHDPEQQGDEDLNEK
jgi:hypothetical protein